MDSATGQNNKGKNIVLSLFAAVGIALVGLLAGTILTGLLLGLLMYVLSVIIGGFSEVGSDLVIYISPICGVLIAVIVGVIGGLWTYKRKSARQ